jgi:molybdopterin molybdotransferase
MLDCVAMQELNQARALILARVPPPARELVPLAAAASRYVLESFASPVDLPPFSNSSMDGYAVRSLDTAGATRHTPRSLRVQGRVAAGESLADPLVSGSCARIFTGAALPAGTDAVIMQEDTRPDPAAGDRVLVLDRVAAGENVRVRGEEVVRGSLLARAGDRLTPGRLCLLAAAGLSEVVVAQRPRVALVATGSELREPGTQLRPGEIYESNRLALAELVRRAGAAPMIRPIVPDDLAATEAALTAAFQDCDVVITCGGVSVGETDFVKAAFERLGGALEFWKVNIKPGKPFVFGRLGWKFLFGLPGNPVSALVTFLLLVRPALLRWQGAADMGLRQTRATLGEALSNESERRHFVRVRIVEGLIYLAGLQASHALRSFAEADGLLDLAPGARLPAGAPVSVSLLD